MSRNQWELIPENPSVMILKKLNYRGMFKFFVDTDMMQMLSMHNWTVIFKVGVPTLRAKFGGEFLYAHRMIAVSKIAKKFKKVFLTHDFDLRAETMTVQLDDGTYTNLKK